MKELKYIILALIVMMTAAQGRCALPGSWRGDLKMGQVKLPIVFNFADGADGRLLCTIDSPTQGAKGIPAEVSLCTSDSLVVVCGVIGATYNAHIGEGMIEGVFKQRGVALDLRLEPEIPVEERRPQTPKGPFPYNSVDTVFTAPDGAVLSATLVMPPVKEGERVPGLVMVTGSGPQNRDEEIFEHKTFLVIADMLARQGIASLRYDDRGVGKSTGDFNLATTYTFRDDARSGIEFMRSLDGIGKVGVLGHSEGGTIAFMLGAEGVPDFVVSLAGMALGGKETLMRQNRDALESAEMTEADRDNSMRLIGLIFDEMIRQNRNGEFYVVDIDSIAAATGVTVPAQVMQSLKMTQRVRTPWIDTFVTIMPEEFLGQVRCPVLAINGTKDMQVNGPDNLAVIERLVPQADIRLMEGLNHPLQHAVTGAISEYGEIRETIAPEVPAAIVEFVRGVVRSE